MAICEQALLQELSYASYLDVQTVILPPPRNRQHVASYARALNAALSRIPYMQLSVRLPIYDPSIFRDESTLSGERPGAKASEAELNMCWEMWDAVRTLCEYNPRLTLGASRSVRASCLLTGPYSAGLDTTSTVGTRSPFALGRRANTTCASPRHDVHRKCQGLPRSSASPQDVLARSHEGGSFAGVLWIFDLMH